jgi:hypothetical protein
MSKSLVGTSWSKIKTHPTSKSPVGTWWSTIKIQAIHEEKCLEIGHDCILSG